MDSNYQHRMTSRQSQSKGSDSKQAFSQLQKVFKTEVCPFLWHSSFWKIMRFWKMRLSSSEWLSVESSTGEPALHLKGFTPPFQLLPALTALCFAHCCSMAPIASCVRAVCMLININQIENNIFFHLNLISKRDLTKALIANVNICSERLRCAVIHSTIIVCRKN